MAGAKNPREENKGWWQNKSGHKNPEDTERIHEKVFDGVLGRACGNSPNPFPSWLGGA